MKSVLPDIDGISENHGMHRSRACSVLQIDNQLSRLGDAGRYVAKMSRQLVIEFSMHILGTYRGGLSNLDETLDDNITYILGRYFFERDIGFVIESLDTIPPAPGRSDELIRYVVTIEHIDSSHCSSVIVGELTTDGYERGCTIREPDGTVLHADLYTPDIRLRRRLKNNAT